MSMAFALLCSLACSKEAPAPERSFEAVDMPTLGPCSCPGKGPASSIWTMGLGKETGQAVFVGLDKDCAVEVTGTYPEGGGPLPKETRVTAWGLDKGVHAVRCPDASGRILFPQRAPSCETTFVNAGGEGPEAFMLLSDTASGRPSPFQVGQPQSLDCALEVKAFAPGWILQEADSVNTQGARSVRMHWQKSGTVTLVVQDREGNPIRWKHFVGAHGVLGTDEEGRVSFGHPLGLVSLLGIGLPPQPLVVLHRGTEEKVVQLDVAPPLRIVFQDKTRMPTCKRGPKLACHLEAETQTGLCYCEPEKDGSTTLLWSGGELRVPQGTRTISLDTGTFTGQVTGTLSGLSRLSLRLVSLDAPPNGLEMSPELAERNEDGSFSFTQVAPGRYALVSGVWPMETQHAGPFTVAEGVVDVGELVAQD